MDPRQFQIEYGSEPRGTYNPADEGWTSYHTFPDVVSEMAKLWYGRLIADPVRSMGNVGAGIIGNVPQIQVDDSTDLRKIGGQYVAPGGSGGIGDIVNALMLYSGPGMLTGKPGLATAGMFAGEQAVGANLAMKKIAERALAAGKDPDEVRRVTGWFKGMEGKPRFEIGDEAMTIAPQFVENLQPKKGLPGLYGAPKGEFLLSDVIDNPKLFESYPELKNTKVVFDKGKGAAFDPENNVIHLQRDGVAMGQDNTWLDSVSHEIQHWVQKKEGFARGGTPKENIGSSEIGPEWRRVKNELLSELSSGKIDKEEYLSRSKMIDKLAAEEQYKKLAGEIEARDVSARRTWDTDMREAVPPTLREDAIIRWGDKDAEEVYRELMR